MDNNQEFKIALKNIFGFKNYLNELQEKAVENVFEAKRDVFIRGFGKSLCYQLPVMMKDNSFVIVISCSISYIKRYHEYFKTKNIKTNYLTCNTSRKNRMAIEKDILSERSTLKILFITPLKYESGYFKTILQQINKQRLFYIVIDQADNITAQQDTVRRSYENLDLKIIRVPIIAISATANSEDQKDVIIKFRLINPKIYVMPVLRSNLYHDTWYINTLFDPLAHLTEFINNCVSCNNDINSVKNDEFWGLIVCKDLEATISIAKYLISVGISALPHCKYILTDDEIRNFECVHKSKSSAALKLKNKYLRNDKNVKVITVCDDIDMLTVTNSPDQIIDKKLLKFVIYWCVLPSIQKYYLQSSQARYFCGMSYCRIYCQLEELTNKNAQSMCYHDESCSHNESSSDIRSSLMQIQCRHKVYSEYYGDTFFVCKYYCDVCKKREEVEEKINGLLQLTYNECLKKKLREVLEFSKNSAMPCDKTLQYECSKEIVSSQYQTKNIESKGKTERNDDHPCLKTNIKNIDKNNNKFDEISQVSSKSSRKTVSSGYQTKKIESEATKKSSDNHPGLDIDIQCIEKNNKFDKKSQASSKCSKKTVSSGYQTKKIDSEATKKSSDNHPDLDIDIQCIEKNNKFDKKSQASSKCTKKTVSSGYQTKATKKSSDNHHGLDTNIQCINENNDKVDKKLEAWSALNEVYEKLFSTQQSTSICKVAPTQSYNTKTISSTSRDKKSRKSNNRNLVTKIRTVEVITIDDEITETEECIVQNKTAQSKENVPNSDNDDVIFIKESRKRRRSQDSSLKRKKPRK